ncbi:hypothetical protein Q3G72_007721 [Acer saccharum]|nr:hypothetical protein Q3G72_007721 [Acer saccharum]
MSQVFPDAQHTFCVFHIAQKFRRSSKNRSLAREFFYNACYKHRLDECDIDLQQMAACNQRYNVTENQINSIVDIQAKTCTCREWDLQKLPCPHALACARYASIPVPEMCSDYYM